MSLPGAKEAPDSGLDSLPGPIDLIRGIKIVDRIVDLSQGSSENVHSVGVLVPLLPVRVVSVSDIHFRFEKRALGFEQVSQGRLYTASRGSKLERAAKQGRQVSPFTFDFFALDRYGKHRNIDK